MSVWQLSAQPVQLYIRFNDGSLSAYPLIEVKKISFENDFLKLQLSSGTAYSWSAATIDHYKYDNTTITSASDVKKNSNLWELSVIPNPSEGKQLLRFRLPAGGDALVKVIDAAGKEVYEKRYFKLAAGEQELSLDWSAVRGQYRLLLQTKDFSVSKAIIRR